MIKFTARPSGVNPSAKWQPTNMVVSGIRVWTSVQPDGRANLNRVGRYGDQYFTSWSQDREPNYI